MTVDELVVGVSLFGYLLGDLAVLADLDAAVDRYVDTHLFLGVSFGDVVRNNVEMVLDHVP